MYISSTGFLHLHVHTYQYFHMSVDKSNRTYNDGGPLYRIDTFWLCTRAQFNVFYVHVLYNAHLYECALRLQHVCLGS